MRNSEGAHHEGFGEWVDLSEALIRGVSHGLTNRISSIDSFVQLQGMGDTEFTVENFLPKESAQLQELARALRLLVIDSETSAIELTPLLRDAMELYNHHGRMHTMRCELKVPADPILPIRVVRSAMLRLVVMLLDMAAAEVQDANGETVEMRLTGTDQELVVHLTCQRTPSEYAMSLAEQAGGALLSGDSVLELRIPTLLALRAK